ncbi:putative zinc finger protein [Tripterygium wilfordii]|uniref:Putative zinc finger protein n=1 Tax=Tripterygium wilfordii TaxID=458696 RepID=A0A7J7CSX2_TRIWF|nr:putative zinc finger protein [Tripterygium wilfordii]
MLETAFLTFRSWRYWATEPFTFNTRPYSHDPCQRPIFYFLDRVEEVGAGQSLTTYKMFNGSDDGKYCERGDYHLPSTVLHVNVSASTLSPDIWKMTCGPKCVKFKVSYSVLPDTFSQCS